MKKGYLALLLLASPLHAAFINKSSAGCSGNCTATTSEIDTTSSTLLVLNLSEFVADPSSATVSDSFGNTWNYSTVFNDASGTGLETVVWYAWNHNGDPLSVGSNHTFSVSGISNPTFVVSAYSGMDTIDDPLDKQSAAKASQPGSVTPDMNGEVVVASVFSRTSATPVQYSIDGGFTMNTTFESGIYKVGEGYLIQTTATPVNPTITNAQGATEITQIVTFRPASNIKSSVPVKKIFGCCIQGGVIR